MKDEREPDLIGANDDALEEKVREMMDPSPDNSKPKAKKVEVKSDDTVSAPEISELPVPKEPLKIKILKDEPEEDEKPTAPLPTVATEAPKKKIKVKKDDVPAGEPETSVLEADTDTSSSVETDSKPEEPVTDKSIEDEIAAEFADEDPEETEEDEPETPETENDETPNEENEDPEPTSEITESSEEDTHEATEAPEVVETNEDDELPVPPELEDDKTAKAVDEIVAHEGDELLAAEDEKLVEAFKPEEKKKKPGHLKRLLSAWWGSPKARWLTLTLIFLLVASAFAVPQSRYFLLNTAQVRSSLSVQVLDDSTQQPLKNVRVSVGEASGVTGADGKAKLTKVKLGPNDLTIEKRAFAAVKTPITVGWGSNPLGQYKLTPTGTQYSFVLSDYLSGKGVEGAEATSGEASALSDQDGKIKLTIDQPLDQFEVNLSGEGLRQETVNIDADNKAVQEVKMVPVRKHVFISKRSGKYDVFKVDIDGKNEQKVLAGTGTERDDMRLISHPNDEVAVLVSTRDNKRNQDGFLLSTLTLLDLKENSAYTIAQSERIEVVDWVGDRLIYVQIAQGASAANPQRHRLMSYDYKTGENKEIASSNYFNDVAVVRGKVYYAPASAYQPGNSSSMFKVDADGGNKQTIVAQEVWNFFRTSYEHLTLSVGNEWYDYKLGDKAPTKLQGQPANIVSRVYVDSSDAKSSLWIDNRDGKGVLLDYEPASQNEKTLRTQSGLKNPVRWITNNVVVYRINTEQETADYALSLNGGEPKKIRDVTNTGGVDSWYYY